MENNNIKPMYKYLLFLSIFFLSCQNEEKNHHQTNINKPQKESITTTNAFQVFDKPFDHLDVEFHEYIYQNNTQNIFNFHTGSIIKIPPGAFIDKNGNNVREDITIHYREFHSVADIIASGINMNYNEGQFETAGMFEIRAFKNGEELQLKPDKEITVNLASYKGDNDFQNFSMNDSIGWTPTETGTIIANATKSEKLETLNHLLDSLEKVCITKPKAYSPGDTDVLDLNLAPHIYDELGFLSDALWKVTQKGDQFTLLNNSGIEWTNIELEPKECNAYTVKLDNWKYRKRENKKEVTFEAEPVWPEQIINRKEKDYKKKKNKFDRAYRQKMIKRRQHQREADILRTFAVNNMGIWNSDRLIKQEGYIACTPIFNFPDHENVDISVFMIINESSVIKFYAPYDNFKINPKKDNTFVAVIDGDKVVKIEADRVKSILANKNFDIQNKKINFKFLPESIKPCNTIEDFNNLVASR